jgi:hypothetical protein
MSHVLCDNRRTIVKTQKARAMEAAHEKQDNSSRYAMFLGVLHLMLNALLNVLSQDPKKLRSRSLWMIKGTLIVTLFHCFLLMLSQGMWGDWCLRRSRFRQRS